MSANIPDNLTLKNWLSPPDLLLRQMLTLILHYFVGLQKKVNISILPVILLRLLKDLSAQMEDSLAYVIRLLPSLTVVSILTNYIVIVM